MEIIKWLLLYTFGAAFLAAVDTYLPFIPPVTPFMAGAIYFQNNFYLFVLPVGISMGIGTVVALYILRRVKGKIFEKINNQKISKVQDKLSFLVHLVGDYAIVIAHSVGLGAPIAYIYVLIDDVNYKSYTIYTIIGRTMLLSLFVAITNLKKSGSNIYLIIVVISYIIVYLIFIFLLLVKYIKYKKYK